MQEAFAAHQRHVARLDPLEEHMRVVLIIDNAPWHRGEPIDRALADHPHPGFYCLPSYSPQLNVIDDSGGCCVGVRPSTACSRRWPT